MKGRIARVKRARIEMRGWKGKIGNKERREMTARENIEVKD